MTKMHWVYLPSLHQEPFSSSRFLHDLHHLQENSVVSHGSQCCGWRGSWSYSLCSELWNLKRQKKEEVQNATLVDDHPKHVDKNPAKNQVLLETCWYALTKRFEKTWLPFNQFANLLPEIFILLRIFILPNWFHPGYVQCLRLLLEAKANSDLAMTNGGTTPLHCAAEHGQHVVVRILLKDGSFDEWSTWC